MGAGASTNDVKMHLKKVSPRSEAFNSLEQAQAEIEQLRKSLAEAKEEIKKLTRARNESDLDSKSSLGNETKKKKNEARAAVMAKPVADNYKVKVIDKPTEVKDLINKSIKPNMLFRSCSTAELIDLVDAFECIEYKQGATVIKQGDEGEWFYVVESGVLDITVKVGEEECKIGVPYEAGAAFGELALMYGSPRAATIRALADCKLWKLNRYDYRGIIGQHKSKRTELQLNFLKNVRIGEKILGDILREHDLHSIALALQEDIFSKDQVIIRQGEKGDVFYLIESGSVNVLTKGENDAEPVLRRTLESGEFFGEKALLNEDVRMATCVAASNVRCLSLMREDFVRMLGNLQDLLDGVDNEPSKEVMEVEGAVTSDKDQLPQENKELDLKDLEIMRTLGIGAFGRVKLVKSKNSNSAGNTYALKCLSKRSIVENGLQDHVLNEKEILSELNHPFILKFYGAMQDDRHIYLLLEVLLGGELFKFLRAETQFPESWSKFYAASVVLAFCQIHARNIAYRDLKPENLVMDSQGYLHIVDFGLAKRIVGGKTWTLCGTPDYLAPEVILNEGHDWGVDYWALGILVYEMTAGSAPFYADDPMEVYEKILSGNLFFPDYFSRSLCDFVKKLLKTYQSKRMGKTKGGTSTVMKHKWFSGFDWDALLSKKMPPPFVPNVKNSEDASNFDSYPEEEDDDYDDDDNAVSQWNPAL